MQLAYLEPRRLQSPLPFCPRPFPGEAVESWIWRIGREFGYSPAKFLRAIGRPSADRKDPTQALTQADIPYLATLAHLPPKELAAMETISAEWRLRAAPDQPFCGHCWLENQRLYGFAHLQGSWMHAGRISCSQHGSWLFSVRDKLGRRHCDPAHRTRYGVSADAIEAMLNHQTDLENRCGRRWIPDAGARLRSFEAAVVGAAAGYLPSEEQWGILSAGDFLNVVHDVSTWSLTNFEAFKAPCPASVYYHDWAPFLPPIFIFPSSYLRSWSPTQPERSMRLCINPDERRNALWITMALLAADYPAMPRTGPAADRISRQRQIFRGKNSAGLSWLVARMQRWPDVYREACWVSWEEMLLPCHSRSAVLVSSRSAAIN
jgi:hypothetical protein